jgi:hypothetical protein
MLALSLYSFDVVLSHQLRPKVYDELFLFE